MMRLLPIAGGETVSAQVVGKDFTEFFRVTRIVLDRGSRNIRRSHAKTWWEGWRRNVTDKRPFRCLDCQWRGWGVDGLVHDDRRQDLDLDALDGVLADVESDVVRHV
jgi:hypothetical protein